ncbi:uncharacterized protein METZ01_LOCUS463841, partial [marine metagenome]
MPQFLQERWQRFIRADPRTGPEDTGTHVIEITDQTSGLPKGPRLEWSSIRPRFRVSWLPPRSGFREP